MSMRGKGVGMVGGGEGGLGRCCGWVRGWIGFWRGCFWGGERGRCLIVKCLSGYLDSACVAGQCSLIKDYMDISHLRIHVVPLSVFFLVLWWWRRLFLLDEIFPVQGTCGVQFQPWCYAFQIEHVILVAWQAND